MNANQNHRIEVPLSLRQKLASFRRALLGQIAGEGVLRSATIACAALLVLLILDRFFDTAWWFRLILLAAIAESVIGAVVRWVMAAHSCRSSLEIAKTVRTRDEVFGDHLVGAIELAGSPSEQSRSESLCRGALRQVAEDAETRDFKDALPPRRWKVMLAGMLSTVAVIAFVGVVSPSLFGNGLERLFFPWGDHPRFTFVQLGDMPSRLVVPRDQDAAWTWRLDDQSLWSPRSATLKVGERKIESEVSEQGSYVFQIPGLIEPVDATLNVGDAVGTMQLIPMQRPELTSIVAHVQPPAYVPRNRDSGSSEMNLADGHLRVVRGSRVEIFLEVSRDLQQAFANGQPLAVNGKSVAFSWDGTEEILELDWTDCEGLHAESPLTLSVTQLDDQPPLLLASAFSIPERVLEGQSLNFRLGVRDDLGVRKVGFEWVSGDRSGEKILGPGLDQVGDSQTEVAAVFQASSLGAPAGKTQLRFWAEDDFPGRGRIYADPIHMKVLTPDEHAVWIANQFARWQQTAMDVRDQELSLFERNRELAQRSIEKRDRAWQDEVARQAEAEAANARQLRALTSQGQALLVDAARNEEVAVGYVEKLAETIETLQELAEKKMPRIAALLNAASEEADFAETIDVETTQGKLPSGESTPETESDGAAADSDPGRLGLAGTTVVDTSSRKAKPSEGEGGESLAAAVEDQTELVAAFDSVADELRAILGNMEGSTLVKRLKSVSRLQDRVASQLGRGIEETFGEPVSGNRDRVALAVVDAQESVKRVRTVLDDMDAFLKRREVPSFAAVQAEMKQADVLQQLSGLRDGVADRPGISLAAAEYWADTMDRWADDLIEPGAESESGEKGSQRQKSVPPEVILEVLRVLEGEVQLREQTRVAEQGRGAMPADQYSGEAVRLSEQQDLLRDRLDVAIDQLAKIPESDVHFKSEMEVLGAASMAMADATETLVQPETGAPAIAAQTEAIELLLRSQKVSPEGGGGGGGNAGASSGGDNAKPAMAMVGRGIGALARERQSVTQMAIGRRRAQVPEQWRPRLQRYFDQLEIKQTQGAGAIEE